MSASIQLLKKGFEVAVTAAAMVQTFEQHWRGCWQKVEGLVTVPYGSTLPTQYIPLIECAHRSAIPMQT